MESLIYIDENLFVIRFFFAIWMINSGRSSQPLARVDVHARNAFKIGGSPGLFVPGSATTCAADRHRTQPRM
jgi:hypothetical protein